MIGRRRTFVTACRLGQNADPALAGVTLEKAEMWMFRRRTGYERAYLSDIRRSTIPLLIEDRDPLVSSCVNVAVVATLSPKY
jgi:hypothetical protein